MRHATAADGGKETTMETTMETACVVFRCRDGAVDYRFAGQALPGGAVPLRAVRWDCVDGATALVDAVDFAPGISTADASAVEAAIVAAIAEAEAFS